MTDVELLLILLQSVAGPVLDDPRLRVVKPRCAPAENGDVTVCARPQSDRLPRLPERYQEGALPKAEATVFGDAKVGIETEQGSVGGIPSNRAMVRLKIPF